MFNASHIHKFSLRRGVIILLALMLCLGLWSDTSAAEAPTILHPDPLSLGLRSGDQGVISIRIDNVQNLYGVEFHLKFDPNVVQVVDADSSKPGVQIAPGDWLKNTFVAVNKVDNTAGTIDFAVTLLNPAPPISGSGVVATITFSAKGNGSSPIQVEKAIIASRDGKEIKSSWQDGAIGVSPLAIAPGVSQTTHGGSGPSESTSSSQAMPVREIVLLGAAGIGVLALLGAVVLAIGAVIIFRRRG